MGEHMDLVVAMATSAVASALGGVFFWLYRRGREREEMRQRAAWHASTANGKSEERVSHVSMLLRPKEEWEALERRVEQLTAERGALDEQLRDVEQANEVLRRDAALASRSLDGGYRELVRYRDYERRIVDALGSVPPGVTHDQIIRDRAKELLDCREWIAVAEATMTELRRQLDKAVAVQGELSRRHVNECDELRRQLRFAQGPGETLKNLLSEEKSQRTKEGDELRKQLQESRQGFKAFHDELCHAVGVFGYNGVSMPVAVRNLMAAYNSKKNQHQATSETLAAVNAEVARLRAECKPRNVAYADANTFISLDKQQREQLSKHGWQNFQSDERTGGHAILLVDLMAGIKLRLEAREKNVAAMAKGSDCYEYRASDNTWWQFNAAMVLELVGAPLKLTEAERERTTEAVRQAQDETRRRVEQAEAARCFDLMSTERMTHEKGRHPTAHDWSRMAETIRLRPYSPYSLRREVTKTEAGNIVSWQVLQRDSDGFKSFSSMEAAMAQLERDRTTWARLEALKKYPVKEEQAVLRSGCVQSDTITVAQGGVEDRSTPATSSSTDSREVERRTLRDVGDALAAWCVHLVGPQRSLVRAFVDMLRHRALSWKTGTVVRDGKVQSWTAETGSFGSAFKTERERDDYIQGTYILTDALRRYKDGMGRLVEVLDDAPDLEPADLLAQRLTTRVLRALAPPRNDDGTAKLSLVADQIDWLTEELDSIVRELRGEVDIEAEEAKLA